MSANDQELPALLAPHILVLKQARKLCIYDGEDLIKTYRISLGSAPIGNKFEEGDGRTPEGEYYIFTKNAKSKFRLSLAISYPGIEAAICGRRNGLISESEYEGIIEALELKKGPPQKTALGGEIYIHGGGTEGDWTRGCIAMTDRDIDEIFAAVSIGTVVRIKP